MAVLDILKQLFSDTGDEGSISPDGRPLKSTVQQYLEDSGVAPQVNMEAEKKRAIQRGLLNFSKALTSSNQDFLPALAGAIPAGSEGYHDATDETSKKQRENAKDLMEKIFGLARVDDTNSTRETIASERNSATMDKLDEIIRHNKTTEGQGSLKIDLQELLGLGKLKQGDRGLDIRENQGDARIDETGRHNLVTEGQGDKRIEQGGARIEQQAINARLDAQKLQAEISGEALNSRKTAAEINKITDDRINQKLERKKVELRLDDPTFAILDPQGHAAALQEYKAYGTELEKLVNQGGSAPAATPSEVPESGAATPQVSNSTSAPVTITSQADFDALAPGQIFINPKDGKKYRKRASGVGR